MFDNLNHYRVFYAVANTGNISKAADALFISQPAISKAISKLEEGLGTALFIRSSKGVTLTEEGKILYQHVTKALDSLSQGEDAIKRINDLGIGQLRIGVSTSLCKHILLDYLQIFIQDNPHIKVTIDCHSTRNTMELLKNGKIDMGLICETDIPVGFKYRKLTEIHDIFIASENYLTNLELREKEETQEGEMHPWLFMGNLTSLLASPSGENEASSSVLSTKEILEKSNLMLLENNNVTRTHIDEYLSRENIHPSQILEVNNMDLLIDFASIGMGVASVVREFAKEQLDNKQVVELPLTTPIKSRTVGFVYPDSKSIPASLAKFLELSRS